VSTPDGSQSVVDPITISAKVNAIAGFGQLISIVLLLVLFAWWWSNRRSARRERLNTTTV
jgi:flagellar biogenesis protein FliO